MKPNKAGIPKNNKDETVIKLIGITKSIGAAIKLKLYNNNT